MKLKRHIKSLFKFVTLGIYIILILELCARIDDRIKWGAPLFGTYSRESLTLVDSFGLRNRPNAQFEKWKINEHGFRGYSISKSKLEGQTRVMVLGASETFGLYEGENMEYPLQMQRILDKKVPGKYQVINAAVPGLSPPRIHRLYDNWLKEFDADIVIYYPSPSVYLMRNPPGADFVKRSEERASNKFGLRIMAKASIVLKRFLPAELQTAMKKVVIKREVSKHPKNWVFQSPPLGRADLFGRHLRELVHRVQESGTRVVLATHATAINNPISEEGLQLLIGWRKLYPHVAESAFLEMEQVGNRIIKQVAEETQSDLVDIDAVLPKTKDVFADHVHFTTAGAGVVAELMAGAVLEIPHSRAVK